MIYELQIRVEPRVAASEQDIKLYVAREKGIDVRTITAVRVMKRSIDARQRFVMVNLSLRVFVNEVPEGDVFRVTEYRHVPDGAPQVVVIGAGPGGLFAALRLIEHGIRPIVLERGKDVRTRKVDLARISREHIVNPESNYSFGEGGAGAYSDGKLYTRSKKRGDGEKILNVFCQHGASITILSDAHPHIGTDKLPRVIENMRKTILDSGGQVHFGTRMTELLLTGNRIVGCVAERHDGETGEDTAVEYRGAVILATGHSARDVYRYLDGRALLEAKGLAVGVRLEHPSELIDQIQYHNRNGRGRYLPAAEYSFVTQSEGRGVYSFCMCPGGFVVPAASGPEQVVVNGMSPSNRGGKWSNSGMVVELRPEDVEGDGVLRMMHYQEELERLSWQQGGRRQTAPAQRMADFVNGRLSYDLPHSSYAPGIVSSPLHFWMPQPVASRLQDGFRQFGRRSHGFLTNEAIIIGVETRTSSPVRIVRESDTLQSPSIEGLFPCGEGAGYAGGIVSAGVDGERCADAAAAYLGR